MSLLSRICSFFGKGFDGNIQTFTYFIPAPPARKSGYREKTFDGLTRQLSNKGFEIVDIKTQAISSNEQPGIYVILKLRATTADAKQLSPSDFPEEFTNDLESTLGHMNPHNANEKSIELPNSSEDGEDEVKGIYYID